MRTDQKSGLRVFTNCKIEFKTRLSFQLPLSSLDVFDHMPKYYNVNIEPV